MAGSAFGMGYNPYTVDCSPPADALKRQTSAPEMSPVIAGLLGNRYPPDMGKGEGP